jgi:predicted LPLAT superfamily acyltransferase
MKYGGKYGNAFFHHIIRRFGVTPAYLAVLGLAVPYYSVIRPSVRKSIYPYIERRFPGQNAWMRFVNSSRHLVNFSETLVDQAAAGILGTQRLNFDFPSGELLREVSRRRKGLVVLTAHVGNYFASMVMGQYLDIPMNVVIDTQNYQGNHFFDLTKEKIPFRIIPPTFEGLITATNALRTGEIVALMGDRKDNTRTIEVNFLGSPVEIPATPYHLAYATGADVGVLLSARTGKLHVRMDFEVIRENSEWQNLGKEAAIHRMAQAYADRLERYVNRYPFMWYNFFDFWELTSKGNK